MMLIVELQMQEQYDTLKESNGTIRSIHHTEPQYESSISSSTPSQRQKSASTLALKRQREPGASSSQATTASKRTRLEPQRSYRSFSNTQPGPEGSQREKCRVSYFQKEDTPATPDTDHGHPTFRNLRRGRRAVTQPSNLRAMRNDRVLSGFPNQQQITPQTLSPRQVSANHLLALQDERTPLVERQTRQGTDEDSVQHFGSFSSVPESQVVGVSAMRVEDTLAEDIPNEQIPPTSIPSRLAIDSSTSQDLSLPSPSLSPVTAAANLHNSASTWGNHGDDSSSDTEDFSFELPARETLNESIPLGSSATYFRDESTDTTLRRKIGSQESHRHPFRPSMTEIPAMLDFFEAIPDEFKSYVMYQLLRRCPKPALHFVADVVNPALKCDFIAQLPIELSLHVIKYLDVKALCRASQVSKKWRLIINADEKVWKELLDRDGFVLPEGELHRAITQGWGWQQPGLDGFERDISLLAAPKSDSEASTASAAMSNVPFKSLSTGRRSKRKAIAKLSSRKQQKRKGTPVDDVDRVPEWMRASSLEGPYAAASAAALAVPYPNCGLASLKSLHLFKSLYQRHYMIRRSWMREDAKPRHIAFRAHDRHVVTCLQFDTDKILTGSDDTHINVYETKTGALSKRLQGHEGGVWALQYEGNVLVSGSTDRSVRVWDIEQGRCIKVFLGHTSTVRCLQILMPTEVGRTADRKAIMIPKQPLIITGSRDSNLRVWKLPQPDDQWYNQASPPQDDGDCPYFVRVLTGHQHSVRAIAAHADTLVSGSYDCTVRVWKISTGETLHRLQGHSQKVYSVVLDHQRNRCISGSMDNLVKVWSLDTGSVLYNLEGHTSLVGLLDLNSNRLVSAAADSTLKIWDPENGHCKSTLTAHTGAITCFQHDSQKVISGSDRTLKMWDVKTGHCVKDLLTDLSGVWQVKFNSTLR